MHVTFERTVFPSDHIFHVERVGWRADTFCHGALTTVSITFQSGNNRCLGFYQFDGGAVTLTHWGSIDDVLRWIDGLLNSNPDGDERYIIQFTNPHDTTMQQYSTRLYGEKL